MATGRRDFLAGTAWMGVAAAASGCMGGRIKLAGAYGAPMQGYRDKPIKTVRVACVGVGSRGAPAVRRLSMIPGTVVTAIADLFQDRIDKEVNWLKENGKHLPKTFAGSDSYKRVCELDDVDVVYSATPWHIHVPVATYAMEHGKHVLTEVPGALTVEGCWQLVETSEATRRHCMMLENCCYGEEELLMLNVCKSGLLGEIVHAEGGYIHDQRSLNYGDRYHTIDGERTDKRPGWVLDIRSKHRGNYYPTHGLGPIAQCLDINRGDNFDFLVSVESKELTGSLYAKEFCKGTEKEHLPNSMGDVNSSLIRTKLGRSILLQYDITTPRPYSRMNMLSGTKGIFRTFPYWLTFEEKIGDGSTHRYFFDEPREKVKSDYMHPLWKTAGKVAEKVGGHGGMDFLMDLRWSYCLQNGLPLDTDVYDCAAWSCLVEITERSVKNGSHPVKVPDFTRGAWKTGTGFPICSIDLAKLPGNLSGAMRNEAAEKAAREEGLSL